MMTVNYKIAISYNGLSKAVLLAATKLTKCNSKLTAPFAPVSDVEDWAIFLSSCLRYCSLASNIAMCNKFSSD